MLGSRSIPDLGPHLLVAVGQLISFPFELHPICGLGLLLVNALANPEEQIRFANTFISDHDELVEVVKRLLGIFQDLAVSFVERFKHT